MVGFTVPGKALSKANNSVLPKLKNVPWRLIKNKSLRASKRRWEAALDYEQRVAVCLLAALPGNQMIGGPIAVVIRFILKSRKLAWDLRKDVDNMAKSVLDGIEKSGRLVLGDQQIVRLTISKTTVTGDPSTRIAIWEWPE